MHFYALLCLVKIDFGAHAGLVFENKMPYLLVYRYVVFTSAARKRSDRNILSKAVWQAANFTV